MMRRRTVRNWLTVTVIVVTAVVFGWYIKEHPGYVAKLCEVQPGWIALITLANVGAMTALVGLYQILVRMLGFRLAPTENMLLTIYSSIANFFGPLQSGPGVRAAYLKAKYKIPIRRYVMVTLIAYGAFAVISAFFLLVGTRPWWQTVLAVVMASSLSAVVIGKAAQKRGQDVKHLTISRKLLVGVVICTLIQSCFIALRSYVSLKAGGSEVSLGQVLSYTGAANFALFVSLTPDAVGIREAFILFAQHIHRVPTQEIVMANIIDRAAYLAFLGFLFAVALSLHAKSRFAVATTPQSMDADDQPKPE